MAFQQFQQGSNNQQSTNQTADGRKKNIKVTSINCDNGRLNMTIWRSDRGGVYVVMTALAKVGNDPTTGIAMYEQKQPKDLPSIYLAGTDAVEVLDALKMIPWQGSTPSCSYTKTCGKNNNTIAVTANGNEIELKINTPNIGDRSVTFKGAPACTTTVNAGWHLFLMMFEKAVNKVLCDKLDPNEFSGIGESSDEELF